MKKIEINKIVEGLDKVRVVGPDESFLRKMEELAISNFKPTLKISYLKVAMIAASLAILIAANIILYSQTGESAAMSDAYNIIPTKSLYNG